MLISLDTSNGYDLDTVESDERVLELEAKAFDNALSDKILQRWPEATIEWEPYQYGSRGIYAENDDGEYDEDIVAEIEEMDITLYNNSDEWTPSDREYDEARQR